MIAILTHSLHPKRLRYRGKEGDTLLEELLNIAVVSLIGPWMLMLKFDRQGFDP